VDVSDLTGRSALVTGAASGIGRATALALAQRGADLFLCDLDEAGLDATRRETAALGRTASCHTVDVASAEQMRAFASSVHERVPAVDILVNNAGVAIGGGFLDTSLEDWQWIVDINLLGVVHGCHFFAPAMVKRAGGGHIANVASAAGFLASAALAAYATTKFAVVGLSEALREELAPHRIGVTAVCPGIINTPITRNARLRGEAMEQEGAREEMVAFYEKRNYGPERVAGGILRAIARNRAVAPVSPEAWAIHYLKRLAPGLLRRLSDLLAARSRRNR
jgi:NAD(P)-dependent dehydrogenase (short-subunit alcohol dehydrogenase family)